MRYRGVLPIGQIAHLSNIWQSTQKGEKQRPIAHLSNIWQSTQKGKSTDNCHQYLLPLQVLLNLWMEVIVDGGDNHLSRCKLKHTVSSNNAKLQGCSLLSFALYMYIEIVLNIDTNSCMYQINVDNNYLFFFNGIGFILQTQKTAYSNGYHLGAKHEVLLLSIFSSTDKC